MKYKEIVFDFDGTIVDTVSALIDYIRDGNVDLDLPPVTDENIEMVRGMSPETIMKELGLSRLQLVGMIRNFVKYAKKNPEIYKVVEGMHQVIHELNRSHTIGVLSSNNKKLIKMVFDLNDLDVFEYYITGAALWGKERKLKKLVKSRKLDSSEILYIGDEVKDVEGARKAGVDILSVSWGYNTYEILESVNKGMVVREPREIIERLVK